MVILSQNTTFQNALFCFQILFSLLDFDSSANCSHNPSLMRRPWPKSPVKIHYKASQFSCSSFKDIQNLCTDDPTPTNPSRRTSAIFHRVRLANSLVRSWAPRLTENRPDPQPESAANDNTPLVLLQPRQAEAEQQPLISIPGAEKRIVVYFTSLRVVRSTFEECRSVRSILRGFRVQIDERDLSMDSGFLNELEAIFGGGGGGQSKLTLPRVFIGGRYIGGAEEIRQLHEAGELKKFVQGLPAAEPGECDICDGYTFILCRECDGSHKLNTEKGSGFKSCTVCNENGLIRCPSCSYAPFSTV